MDPRDRADAALARASARNRWAVTPNNAMKPIPDETENGVPESFSARRPPTGDDRITARTVISGNFMFE